MKLVLTALGLSEDADETNTLSAVETLKAGRDAAVEALAAQTAKVDTLKLVRIDADGSAS